MKFKYYLRGIGVGMILAVILYSTIIIPRKYKMTDEEIKDRAGELGMVQKEETDVDLSALSQPPSPVGAGGLTPVPTGDGDLTPAPTGDGSLTPVPTGDGDLTPAPTGDEGVTPAPDVTGEAQDPSAPSEPNAPNPPEAITPPTAPDDAKPSGAAGIPETDVTPGTSAQLPTEPGSSIDTPSVPADGGLVSLKITPGMESIDVARKAFEAGLVDDVGAFDQYLTQNGYDMTIRIGTFSIPEGATYEEIAKIVTMQ